MNKENVKYKNTDQELVLEAQKYEAAFSKLYDRYFEQIFYFIFKRVGDEAASGDICQEAMLKAMYNIKKYEDRGIPFSAWLYRIASNEVNLFFRKQKKNFSVTLEEKHVQDLMEEVEIAKTQEIDTQEKIIQLLNSLKPEYTEIIELRFFMQYSFKDIAEFYDISEANAKMRLYRILDKIKKSWEVDS